MLGLVKRISHNFTNIQCRKAIYFDHVCSYLEIVLYCIVLCPDYDVDIDIIESVQKKFVILNL